MDGARHLQSLSAAELGAVAELWKRERREFLASFGGTSMLPTIRAVAVARTAAETFVVFRPHSSNFVRPPPAA